MKPNSIASLVFPVKSIDTSAKFYETLGFRMGARDDNRLTFYINWFSVIFVEMDDMKPATDIGPYICIKVDDVDEYHRGVLDAGFVPVSEPRDWPWGRREFTLNDPDGYKLTFFQKI